MADGYTRLQIQATLFAETITAKSQTDGGRGQGLPLILTIEREQIGFQLQVERFLLIEVLLKGKIIAGAEKTHRQSMVAAGKIIQIAFYRKIPNIVTKLKRGFEKTERRSAYVLAARHQEVTEKCRQKNML